MAEEAEEPRAEEEAQVKQPPQKLSRPPVSTPSPEFEKGNNGYDYFPAPSPPVLPPSQAQGTLRKSHETILAKPPTPKPPPQPPALKFSPETVSATSPAPRPLFNLSDNNFAPTPLLENVSSILPASPPPPKPPDLLLLPDTVLVPPPLTPPPQSPQKPPPPPKPPDRNLTDRALPPRHSISIDLHSSEFYHHVTNSHLQNFPPLDLCFVILGQSHPSKESTIRALCQLPIKNCHVSKLLLPLKSKRMTCSCFCVQVKFHAPAAIQLQNFKSTPRHY
ncbi:hypothetical protein A2U01_0002338 [Trifolium medium]|uniref:Uncharacterized protein n=1 Tax=Trifolium medium TaxID=97028 RepID=A0A392M467_9FABA|nr:hypothetical protein [Trifolium medium]